MWDFYHIQEEERKILTEQAKGLSAQVCRSINRPQQTLFCEPESWHNGTNAKNVRFKMSGPVSVMTHSVQCTSCTVFPSQP